MYINLAYYGWWEMLWMLEQFAFSFKLLIFLIHQSLHVEIQLKRVPYKTLHVTNWSLVQYIIHLVWLFPGKSILYKLLLSSFKCVKTIFFVILSANSSVEYLIKNWLCKYSIYYRVSHYLFTITLCHYSLCS